MRRRRSTLTILLLAGAVLLALVGLTLVGVYVFYLRQPAPPTAVVPGPWAVVEAEAINPPLALRTLAGEAPADTIKAVLSVGDLDTAYATLVFSPSLSDAERVGHLLLLAQRFMTTEQVDKAMACLRQVHALIVLSPSLADVARADATLQAASQWSRLQRPDAARWSLIQAQVIAQHSPRLRPAQRRDIWLRLAAAYAGLGDEERATAARRAADRPSNVTPQQAPAALLPTFQAELPLPPEIAELQASRQQRAVTLIEQWIALEGGDVGPEAADLAEFLRREDAARLAYYDQVAETTPQLAMQAAAAWERVTWLTLKYRLARRGFGLSLVPEWEENAPLIRAELTKACETLFQLYGDQATALPAAAEMEQAWVELLRQAILLGQLDLYPDVPEDQLVARLQEAQERLLAMQGSVFRVSSYFEDDQRLFTLEGAGGE